MTCPTGTTLDSFKDCACTEDAEYRANFPEGTTDEDIATSVELSIETYLYDQEFGSFIDPETVYYDLVNAVIIEPDSAMNLFTGAGVILSAVYAMF